MHKQFEKDHIHKCGDCSCFVRGAYRSKVLQKCARYGFTHSIASDWAQKWQACGKFNVPLGNERPLIEYHKFREDKGIEIDGQIRMEG